MRPWLAARRTAAAPRRQRAFTLIEGLVVVTIGALLLAVAVPSFVDYIRVQRLKAVAAQVANDMQYARSEATSRNEWLRVVFRGNADATCYSLFTSTSNGNRCDCRPGVGAACTIAGTREVRTAWLPRSERILVGVAAGHPTAFAFDHITGGIASIPTDIDSSPLDLFTTQVILDATRTLHVQINRSGRVTVCAPPGSKLGEAAC